MIRIFPSRHLRRLRSVGVLAMLSLAACNSAVTFQDVSNQKSQALRGVSADPLECLQKTADFQLNTSIDSFQLKGGILKYLEVVPQSESLWQGECFIFDDRIALDHDRNPSAYRLCSVCGQPVRGGGASGPRQHCPKCG